MLSELKRYLEVAASPEYAQMITDADTALLALGKSDFEFVITDILMTMDTQHSEATLVSISEVYYKEIKGIITEHGIEVQGLDLNILTAVVAGITIVQDIEDKDPILRILESDADDEGKLCEILNISTGVETIDFEDVITGVNPALLKLLEQVLTRGDVGEIREVLVNTRANVIKKFMVKFPDAIPTSFVETKLPLNRDLEFYIKHYHTYLDTWKLERTLHDTAADALGLVIISNALIVEQTLHEVMDDLFHTLDEIQKATAYIKPALIEVTANEQT